MAKRKTYGEIIRSNREERGLTQRELSEAIGITDGYCAHIERLVKLPSVELCQNIAAAFDFSDKELNELLEAVEDSRLERTQARIRTRGMVTRRKLARGGRAGEGKGESDKVDARTIARDLADNPKLEQGYRYLRRALADPRQRDAVLKTLEAFARTS